MRGLRAGSEKTVVAQQELELGDRRLQLSSPAFPDRGTLPVRCTADGEGVSPPLTWSEPPTGTVCFALIVEDPDAPSSQPFVHALVAGIPATDRELEEGALGPGARTEAATVGRNSFLQQGWLPPDPPPGHGPHDYVFQLFALSETPELGDSPGRREFTKAIAGTVLAAGVLIGTYERPA